MTVVHVETAREMLRRSRRRCPPTSRSWPPRSPTGAPASGRASKIKKDGRAGRRRCALVENPDILATVGHRRAAARRWSSASPPRPKDLIANAAAKLARKGADWIVANDVSRRGRRHEFAPGLDFVAHQPGEQHVGVGGVVDLDLQQRAHIGIERRFPQLLGVHLAKTLVALHGQALAAGGEHRVEQRQRPGERLGHILAAQHRRLA